MWGKSNLFDWYIVAQDKKYLCATCLWVRTFEWLSAVARLVPFFARSLLHMDQEGAASSAPDEGPADPAVHAAIAQLDLASGVAVVVEPGVEQTVNTPENPVDDTAKEE